MKQFLVMLASIALGIFLFHLIMGQQDSSLFSCVQGVWKQQIELKSYQP